MELHISIYRAPLITNYAALFELWGSIKLTHRTLCHAIFFLTRLAWFLPEASIGLRVLPLPASVRPSVRQSVRPSVRHQVFPRDNSSPVQARITKFGPYVSKTLVKIPIFFWFFFLGGGGRGIDWPWPSRSNLTSKFGSKGWLNMICQF